MLVYEGDFPDPHVLATAQGYVAFATQSGTRNVAVASSADLRSWALLGDALPALPDWAEAGFTWSPAVVRLGGRYVMYVAVRPKGYGRQAIAACVSDHAAGPYTPVPGGPLVFQRRRGGSIDPDPYVTADGTAHLLWKSDGELVRRSSALWSAPLSVDGLRLTAPARRLLVRDADWEGPLIEAPCLWQTAAGSYLFYSAGRWQDDSYGIGYAYATETSGPYVKAGAAWFTGGPQAAGPGGQSIVTGPDGDVLLAYHAWMPGRVGYDKGGVRALHIDRLRLDDAGRPVRVDWWTGQ